MGLERPTEDVRWGIVGTGAIADVFATSLAASGAGRVWRVVSRSQERAQSFCERHGGEVVTSLATMLDADLDCVYVATPHSLHDEGVRASIDAGVPVLCEKPLTTSADATEALIQLARERGVLLVEAWMYRTHPQIARALQLVFDEDRIGAVRSVTARFGFEASFDPGHRLFNPDLGGGAILDVGGYPASFAMLFGRGDPEFTGIDGELGETDVDVSGSATLRFANGVRAVIEVSLQEDLGRVGIVEGDRGAVIFDDPFVPGGDRRSTDARLTVVTDAGDEVVLVGSPHDCYGLEALAFCDAVRRGCDVGPPMVTSEETIVIARVLEGWRAGIA